MGHKIIGLFVLLFSMVAHATPVTWVLQDFHFNDGGTAYGSFTADSDTRQLYNIDIFTTQGANLAGRHYISTAGVWGSRPFGIGGTLAFSDVLGPDFQGAGWFRITANINFNASPGTIVRQRLNVGAESFCINAECSSAANEITNPGMSRNTLSGVLVAIPEPETYAMMLAGLGLLGFASRRRKPQAV